MRQNIESALSSQFTRLDLLSDYDTAYKSTQKCVTVLERLKTRSNIETDKVDAATHSLVEAKKLEVEAKEVYEAVSIQLKEEYNTRFSGRVMHDMVETMDEYVSVQIESAKNLVNAIEILNRDMTSL